MGAQVHVEAVVPDWIAPVPVNMTRQRSAKQPPQPVHSKVNPAKIQRWGQNFDPNGMTSRRLAGLEPESPSSCVLVAMVPFFLTLMILAHLFFRRATAPRKPLSRGVRIVRKKP